MTMSDLFAARSQMAVSLGFHIVFAVVGIGMPGHFLCRFQTSTCEIYIDVFNRGKILTKGDCVKYLLQSSHSFQESHLAPVTTRRMLLRICMNLHHIYMQANDTANVARLQRYLVALSN